MVTRLFNLWPAEGYRVPVLPKGKSYDQLSLAQTDSNPIASKWVVEDLVWAADEPVLLRPEISKGTALCLPASLAESVVTDRRNLELLPVRIEREEWVLVHTIGVVDGEVHLASCESSTTTVPGQRVYRWLNLVHPQPLPGEFLHVRGSVYGPHVTESFVDRINALGLRGLWFEHIGHVIADPSQAVAKPPPAPVARTKPLRQPKLTAKTLAKGELEELRASGEALSRRLGIDARASVEQTLEALTASLHDLRVAWFELSKEEQVDALLGAAAIFGELICRVHGWSWVELRQSGGGRWVAVASPRATHALAVVPYVRQQIDTEAPTVALLFNMISAGQLPPAESSGTVSIG